MDEVIKWYKTNHFHPFYGDRIGIHVTGTYISCAHRNMQRSMVTHTWRIWYANNCQQAA